MITQVLLDEAAALLEACRAEQVSLPPRRAALLIITVRSG